MFDTLLKSLHLKMTYSVNTFIYAIKQIPGLRRILSDKLYTLGWLKALLMVFSILKELIMTFFRKFLYVGLFIALPLASDFLRAEDETFILPEWRVVLQVLIVLTITGGMANNVMFEGSMNNYYAIFLLRMDPKKHAIANYVYKLFTVFIGFIPVSILGAWLIKAPLWQGLLIPFFVIGVKLVFTAGEIIFFNRKLKQKDEKEKKVFLRTRKGRSTGYIKTFVIGALLAVAYIPAALKLILPQNILIAIMIAFIILGIVSIFIIKNFKGYRKAYQTAISEFMEAQSMLLASASSIQQKRIDDTREVKSNKNGFEFLNELFVKRHRKILWRSSRNSAIGIGILIVIACVFMLVFPEGKEVVNTMITENLRMVAFVMYLINKGGNYTQALFSNCDHSLLSYPVYRKGSNILKLFRLRLIEISKVNMVPAACLALGLALLLFLSGGPENPIYYLVVIVSVLALGVFFSVHYLTMYYLLQPYNINTEIKSGLYSLIMGATYMVCYMMIQIEVPAMIFGIAAAGFSIVYSILACTLAYTLAPKTFKIRN